MSTNETAVNPFKSVLPQAGVSKSEIWDEIQSIAVAAVGEAVERKEPLASFHTTTAYAEVIRQIRKDYALHAEKFADRPRRITRCQGGGLVFLPGITQTPIDFMILEPIFCNGNATIGGIGVDMDHYYVLLKKCDVFVQDGSQLVAVVMMYIE